MPYLCKLQLQSHLALSHHAAQSPHTMTDVHGGRSAAIPPQHGRTRADSKLPAGPQRRAAHHRQAQKGAERADDPSTVKSRLHFLACD